MTLDCTSRYRTARAAGRPTRVQATTAAAPRPNQPRRTRGQCCSAVSTIEPIQSTAPTMTPTARARSTSGCTAAFRAVRTPRPARLARRGTHPAPARRSSRIQPSTFQRCAAGRPPAGPSRGRAGGSRRRTGTSRRHGAAAARVRPAALTTRSRRPRTIAHHLSRQVSVRPVPLSPGRT